MLSQGQNDVFGMKFEEGCICQTVQFLNSEDGAKCSPRGKMIFWYEV